MGNRKILVCPPGSYVHDGVLALPTTWNGVEFILSSQSESEESSALSAYERPDLEETPSNEEE